MANYTKEEQFKLIRENWVNLKNIDNQYDEVCLEAVKNCVYAIEHIKKPTEEMMLEAVSENGLLINCIENPTDEVKLKALNDCGSAIAYIENPTEEMMLEAIKRNASTIQYIKNPTDTVKLLAVKKDGYVIECIEEVNYEICFAAILNMIKSFSNIKCDYENLKVENIVFLISNLNLEDFIEEYENGYSELYLKEYNENADDKIVVIDKYVFDKLKDYLLNFNKGNYFIVDNSVDIGIIKELAISNNELIYLKYIDKEQISNQHKALLSKIMKVDDLIIV